MANTGNKVVLTLKEIYTYNSQPTGNTKTNALADPNYIAPAQDLTACPVTYTTTCPTVLATGHTGTAEYEFAVIASVINNPAIRRVVVKLKNGGGTVIDSATFLLPHSNYFSGSLTGAAGSYSITVELQGQAGNVVNDCGSLASVTIT